MCGGGGKTFLIYREESDEGDTPTTLVYLFDEALYIPRKICDTSLLDPGAKVVSEFFADGFCLWW